ncbi:VOC family protein [Deinococcus maricopensis]|uniref:Glyoxalase/bleomycin resistance protein/dioxygenase n=1 Tax=Deinococcus maricopensis (strain DSM 21211 / LMG 22137 / NRRL B-23946 / LB-34) TaxID=709986 RepID=E8UAD6_DEIML|nr:VOC family protein [Deinococcus maricopensis]ADV68025.1 Glyoxalase/bleomycin resistance protein/dioxygenase [Deinococcus maricopensis DSM 21211]
MITGLDHVQIEAPPAHEDAARAFYGTFLGLPELQKPAALQANGGVWFALPDGRQLHTGTVQDFTARDKGHPCLRTGDLTALLAHARAHGIPAEEDTRLAPLRRAYLRDPFGNRLEIVEGHHSSVPTH